MKNHLVKGNLREKRYATSKEILELIGKGALIAVLWFSPYGGAELMKRFALKMLDKVWEKYDKARLRQSLKRMVDRKILKIKENGDETSIEISEKGRKLLFRYNFREMKLEKPRLWDGKWRVVIFDVGEERKVFRDALRKKIKLLGLYQLQKSVFVTPYPCEKEIAFLRQYFGIGNEVSCFTTLDLEEGDFLKKKFSLTKTR